ncbi:unnamed protein product [Ranitomeya imitator]|uniref:EGF-like domain-containing protein n=1 Tax=Ranitomeya imitator TaxID=111125 RepID=A0ABN9LY20_9NEOB|nr:unnamed protein product [Ranitomeya imitator]
MAGETENVVLGTEPKDAKMSATGVANLGLECNSDRLPLEAVAVEVMGTPLNPELEVFPGLQSTTSNTISSTGLQSTTSNTISSTGVSSTLRSSHNLTCLKLPPNTTNCNNHTCPEGQLYDKSFPCIPGYKKENDGDCVEVNECRDGIHQCDAYAECKNIQSGYYCECKKGFQRENVTEFCPSEEKKLNKCTVKCIYNTSKENCVDESFQCKLKNFTDNFTPLCQDVPSQQRLSMEEFLKGLDDLINGFSYGSKTDRLQNVGHLLNRVEVTIQNLALLEQRPMSHIDQNKMISEYCHGLLLKGLSRLGMKVFHQSMRIQNLTVYGAFAVSIL